MEETEENLLEQLETEGKHIAMCRKKLTTIIGSGKIINSSKITSLCDCLNMHIITFDKISAELARLEAVNHNLFHLT